MKPLHLAAVCLPVLLLATSCWSLGKGAWQTDVVMSTGRVMVQASFETVHGRRVLREIVATSTVSTTRRLKALEATVSIDTNGDATPSVDEKRAIWSVEALEGTTRLAFTGSYNRAKDDVFAGPALLSVRVTYATEDGSVEEERVLSPIDL